MLAFSPTPHAFPNLDIGGLEPLFRAHLRSASTDVYVSPHRPRPPLPPSLIPLRSGSLGAEPDPTPLPVPPPPSPRLHPLWVVVLRSPRITLYLGHGGVSGWVSVEGLHRAATFQEEEEALEVAEQAGPKWGALGFVVRVATVEALQ